MSRKTKYFQIIHNAEEEGQKRDSVGRPSLAASARTTTPKTACFMKAGPILHDGSTNGHTTTCAAIVGAEIPCTHHSGTHSALLSPKSCRKFARPVSTYKQEAPQEAYPNFPNKIMLSDPPQPQRSTMFHSPLQPSSKVRGPFLS